MWENWKPERFFVAPYQISMYYWDKYCHKNGPKPIFPDDEINDLAAVISNSKPAALLNIGQNVEGVESYLPSFRIDNCQEIALDIISIAIDNNVFMLRTHDLKNLICSKNKEIVDLIYKIEQEYNEFNGRKLGELLGYPEQSINDFFNPLLSIPSIPQNVENVENKPIFTLPPYMFL